MFSLVALTWHWAIPENIHDHTCTRMAFWNSKRQGGFFELEIQEHWGVLMTGIPKAWGGGGLDLEFPQGKDDNPNYLEQLK